MRKTIDIFIVICIILVVVLLIKMNYIARVVEVKEKYTVTAIKQKSGKIRYFKEIDNEKVNIDKVELEDLLRRYDVVIEVEGD